jgi:transitional endoplasmic reticulum ATPase
MLDPALLRAGRLERHLYIPPPNADERYEILQVYAQSTLHLFAQDINLREVASSMRFFVGADIEAFVQQVKIAALDTFEEEENTDNPYPLIQITRDHVNSVLLNMRGTLENQMLEKYEQGSWRLLHSTAEQDTLHYAAKLIQALDEYALRSLNIHAEQNVQLRALSERLREEVFWREKDFSILLDLISKTEDFLGKIDKKKVTFTVK